MPSNILYDVTVDDGKYRFVYFNDGKTPMAYRHGEPWDPRIKEMVGDKALLSLVAEIDELRQKARLADKTEISSDPATVPETIPVTTEIKIDWEQIANCIVGLVENRYSPWLGTFTYGDDALSVSLRDRMKDEGKIWYSEADYFTLGGRMAFTFDDPEGEEGEFESSKTVGARDMADALAIMAGKNAVQFANLIGENDDAITHDVFGQMLLLGDEIYG